MDYEKYKNTLPYPDRMKKPSLKNTHPTIEEATEYAAELGTFTYKEETFRELRDAYRVEDNRLFELFKADALEEAGLAGHKNADKLFAKAWEDGHASGHYAVFNHLCDLAELVL